jgi:hypothetical protein
MVRAETLLIDDDGVAHHMATDTLDYQGLDRHNLAVVQGAYCHAKAQMLNGLSQASFEQAKLKGLMGDVEAEAYRAAVAMG